MEGQGPKLGLLYEHAIEQAINKQINTGIIDGRILEAWSSGEQGVIFCQRTDIGYCLGEREGRCGRDGT